MKMSNVALALSGVVFGGVLLSSHASAAEGRLVVYCSAQNTMCEQKLWLLRKIRYQNQFYPWWYRHNFSQN